MTDFIDLVNKLRGAVTAPAVKYVYHYIPKERTEPAADDTPLEPEASYFRLFLSEVFLSNSREWLDEVYPAIHSTVRLKLRSDPVEISRVAGPSKESLGIGVYLNYILADVMPYNGDVVVLDVTLLKLKGTQRMAAIIKVMQNFSSLVTPPLSQVLDITRQLTDGMSALTVAHEGTEVLGFHDSFSNDAGAAHKPLRPGYYAVIRATQGQINPANLCVKEGRLLYGAGGAAPTPFQGYDYMLLRLEGFKERRLSGLKNIQEPLDQALEALQLGEEQKAATFAGAAQAAVFQSLDLARQDRGRVIKAIQAEMAAAKAGAHGAVAAGPRDLDTIVATRGMTREQARPLSKLGFEDLLAS